MSFSADSGRSDTGSCGGEAKPEHADRSGSDRADKSHAGYTRAGLAAGGTGSSRGKGAEAGRRAAGMDRGRKRKTDSLCVGYGKGSTDDCGL